MSAAAMPDNANIWISTFCDQLGDNVMFYKNLHLFYGDREFDKMFPCVPQKYANVIRRRGKAVSERKD